MMHPRLAPALALACLLSAPLAAPLAAQDLAAYEAADQAALLAWQDMPLILRNASFVTGEAVGYGLHTPRADSVFAPDEPLLVYAEPLGYGWRGNDDGTHTFGLSIDFKLRDPAGTLIGEREGFQRAVITSRHRNREFFITLTLNLTSAPAGDYVLEYLVHDLVSEKTATMSLPFTIAAP
ncbi:MAG: hypothetical protein KJZ59_09405 [Pararhodobacter sp.]|nr:hypothetical protein [Pararhodobacter sp.]